MLTILDKLAEPGVPRVLLLVGVLAVVGVLVGLLVYHFRRRGDPSG